MEGGALGETKRKKREGGPRAVERLRGLIWEVLVRLCSCEVV